MEIIQKKLSELQPYERNPRDNGNAVFFVSESIKNYGFNVPIVIDKNNVIVAGHTRYLAAKKLKLKDVPCVIADELSEAQVTAFRIADNRAAEESGWDTSKLKMELEQLANEDYDLAKTGFEYDAIKDILSEEQAEREAAKRSNTVSNTRADSETSNVVVCPRCGYELKGDEV